MDIFGAIGRLAQRWRHWILLGWLCVLVGGVAIGGQLFDRLGTVDSLSAGSESARGQARIEELTADGPVVFAVVEGIESYTAELGENVQGVAAEIRAVPGVVEVNSIYTPSTGRPGEQRSILVLVQFAEHLTEPELEAAEDTVVAGLHQIQAGSVQVGGDHLAQRAFGTQAAKDLAIGESVAFALLIVALVIILGGLVAAVLPLTVAIVGVSATLLVLFGLSAFTTVGEYSVNIVTLLGIGLAVDYSLLIVTRFREQRAAGDDVAASIETATVRAGKAVAVSGLAVAGALAGLLVFSEPLLASMALGGMVAVLLTTALALTAVPAMLAIAGARIRPAGPRRFAGRDDPERGAARETVLVRLAGYGQRRPVWVAIAATLVLVALALPLVSANFANSDVRALPATLPERQAYEAYERLFGEGRPSPVTLVAEVDPSAPEAVAYLNQLGTLDGLVGLAVRSGVPAGSMVLDLQAAGVSGGEESRDLVRAVREAAPTYAILVTGDAAEVVDYQDSVAARLPYVVVVVVTAMLALLYALTGSLVVPIKAVALNVLTLVASLGVVVAVFQWGWGEPVLRFDSWGAVDLTTPLLLFVFIFGLTMDYEVFLLSRIKEEFDRTGDNDAAVMRGIAASGPVVTAAAVCMTIVFLGFAVGGLVPVKEIGVGMAVAVILDVTIVRGLLLPATMTLLGDRNWWSPWRPRPDATPARAEAPAEVPG